MLESEVGEDDLARVPRLAAGCDPTKVKLSPAEGFLLSRIDGQTTWKLLREIGGLSSGQVDVCVEEWLAEGIIDIDGRAPRVKRRQLDPEEQKEEERRNRRTSGKINPALIDPTLDLDSGTQREILSMEQRLDVDYFTILGVERDCDDRDIKRAYFKLSKKFHPDLYFRREIGAYKKRLNTIFKQISEAYELLSDPASREQVEKAIREEERAAQAAAGLPGNSTSRGGRSEAGSTAGRPLTAVERLRQRMPFRVPEEVRKAKQDKGADFFKAAQADEKMGRLAEAASNLRLAVAFDPFDQEYKRAFGALQAKLARERIEELLALPAASLGQSDRREAERLCEEILLHAADDPDANCLAARIFLTLEDFERALEYIQRALEADADRGDYLRIMAEVYVGRGARGHAIATLQRVLDRNQGDIEARKMLDGLKQNQRRNAVNGGKK